MNHPDKMQSPIFCESGRKQEFDWRQELKLSAVGLVQGLI